MGVVEGVVEKGVLTVTISRPAQLNALNTEVLTELDATFTKFRHAQELRVAVLRSAGEKAFIAGADIGEMAASDAATLQQFIELGQKVTRTIEDFPVPVIAVVQGFALGGGLEMALACDLIIASDGAKFGQPEVNLGILPGFGGTQRLIQRCGIGTARRLVYTAEIISAEEALKLHVIEAMVPAAELETTVARYCETIVSKGPLAIRASKKVLREYEEKSLHEGLVREATSFIALFESGQPQAGFSAFVAKKKPVF